MRTRKVGSLTCGGLLVLFGLLFLAHIIIPTLTYTFIFKLWPLVLIFLGIEMLLANIKRTEECAIKYDLGAIALVVILAVFSMGMGLVEFCITNPPSYYYW